MSIKLPNNKKEFVAVWSGFEDGAEGPDRIVIESDGRCRWQMRTESAFPCDPNSENAEIWNDKYYVWEEGGGVRVDALQRVMVNMLLALRRLAGFYLRPDTSPEFPSIISDKENVIAKMKGNKMLIVNVEGSSHDGEPFVSIRTNKALDPGEWMAALGSLAKAIDSYRGEFE